MVILIWFFKVCFFDPFGPIDKLAKSEVKYPYRPIFKFFIFRSDDISIRCIIINLILLSLMLSEGGEENSHAFASPCKRAATTRATSSIIRRGQKDTEANIIQF